MCLDFESLMRRLKGADLKLFRVQTSILTLRIQVMNLFLSQGHHHGLCASGCDVGIAVRLKAFRAYLSVVTHSEPDLSFRWAGRR